MNGVIDWLQKCIASSSAYQSHQKVGNTLHLLGVFLRPLKPDLFASLPTATKVKPINAM